MGGLMTPLAFKMTKALCDTPRREWMPIEWRWHEALGGSHFFDCTEITSLCEDLANTYYTKMGADKNLIFLPAPKTWLEWDRTRLGLQKPTETSVWKEVDRQILQELTVHEWTTKEVV